MPKPDVSDERIPQILQAAAQIFSQHGVDGASMAQIARASGLSKATIYYYFKSKDEMVAALVQHLFEDDEPALQALLQDERPVGQRLRQYSHDLLRLLNQNQALWPIFAEFRARATRNEAMQAIVGAYFERYIAAFTTLIEQGMAQGDLPADTVASDVAIAYVALIEGSLLLAQTSGQRLEAVLLVSVDVFLQGLTR